MKSIPQTDSSGKKCWVIKCWVNEFGNFHREDGPAIEDTQGGKSWLIDGRYHRLDGPAIDDHLGKDWFVNGIRHRIDGPAIERKDGYKEWYLNGINLSEAAHKDYIKNMSAIATFPTKIDVYGNKMWLNASGQYHREDGPAIIYASGDKAWYKNNNLHREDGPAFEYANGFKMWYIDNNNLTEKQFNEWVAKKKLETKTINANNNKKETVKTMSNETTKPSFMDMVKKDGTAAGYRIASTQIVNGVRAAMLKVFESNGFGGEKLAMAAELLDTEFGKALISIMIGFGLNYAPVLNEDPRVQKLSEEFRINGFATAGNAVLGVAMESFLPVIQDALKALPNVEEEKAETSTKARVAPHTPSAPDSDDEEEEEEEIVAKKKMSKVA